MAQSGRLRRTEVVLFWSMVVASFALVFAVAVLPDCRRNMALQQKLGEMRRANVELAGRVQGLEAETNALRHDAFYVEKLARRLLNLRRPGESIVLGIAPEFAEEELPDEMPEAPPASILYQVMGLLKPFSGDPSIRIAALVLALFNLLAAFLLFGQVDHRVPVRRYSL